MSELKPCPFCGGEARYTPACAQANEVKCNKCHAKSMRVFMPDLYYPNWKDANKAKAIEAWNTRHITRADIPESLVREIQAEVFTLSAAIARMFDQAKYAAQELDARAAELREQKDETV